MNGSSEQKSGRSFQVQGADGQPVAVAAGEYYINTKARCRRMTLNSLSADARRVYACLELHTMGFQQELAITMDRGQSRSLTPADVADETGLSRQNVRAGLEELETAGLGERRSTDGKGLRKGKIELYCFAIPRKPGDKHCSPQKLQFPDWFPEDWAPLRSFIARKKLQLSLDEVLARSYIQEGIEVARAYKEAEIVAVRFLERVFARTQKSALNKEEITDIKKEKKPPSARAAAVGESQSTSEPASSSFSLQQQKPERKPPKRSARDQAMWDALDPRFKNS
jgi:hypothetical protein